MIQTNLARRGFLFGAAGLGAGAVLAGCTSNEPEQQNNPQQQNLAQGDNAQPGQPVTIGFSAPAADHGWMAAMTINARSAAEQFSDVTLNATEGTNDVNQQIAQVESLINAGVDVLVILPFDGKALTQVGRQAMDAGIPVVNVDRVFDTPLAYRAWIGGDNYRMGVNAGNYIAERLQRENVNNPVIGEVAGIDSLPLTQERSQGFRDALQRHGLSVGPRVSAEFTPESGERQTANLLQGAQTLHALWNHDDDQGVGVVAAIENAGRNDFFMVGGAGSTNMMNLIKADSGPVKATVLYSPSMASSAIAMARLLGQNKGLGDLAEHEIPSEITTYSAVVTRENVDNYMDVGFDS
ncbi:sugar ABC transporter substrate-binding protein [Prauserella sp. PE36]|uniref:Substrate-binding domain-containing protein n=1 Tax=Prauserella endophytica TaxID=1592324 RepID=A0ABY2S6K3_9PSEU|nr:MULTISPECIES: substrate-binding domain-containing protein [Prauserella]PXY21753.1 sugar ABC transporter substrate-binding protein [Prauserella coralliicola]RBM13828.1 sugar ABC transporter substrate-binding protein [Prauserella sp. PE36]TKG71543.1 substrate-binding domain-containing protein [Prauserella endophytica]